VTLGRDRDENLHNDPIVKGFGMPKWSPQINHLAYVDDTILFCSRDDKPLKKMLKSLEIIWTINKF